MSCTQSTGTRRRLRRWRRARRGPSWSSPFTAKVRVRRDSGDRAREAGPEPTRVRPAARGEGGGELALHAAVADGAVKTGATLWSMENCSFEDPTIECALTPILELGAHDGGVKQVAWNPSGDVERVVSIDNSSLHLWALDKLKSVGATDAAKVPSSDRQGPARVHAIVEETDRAAGVA